MITEYEAWVFEVSSSPEVLTIQVVYHKCTYSCSVVSVVLDMISKLSIICSANKHYTVRGIRNNVAHISAKDMTFHKVNNITKPMLRHTYEPQILPYYVTQQFAVNYWTFFKIRSSIQNTFIAEMQQYYKLFFYFAT